MTGWLRPAVAALILGLLFVGLLAGVRDLPPVGDPASPASTHLSPRFIEEARRETGALNMVTAVLADYRGYDTLGETAVIFAAGLGVFVILAGSVGGPRRDRPGPGLSYRVDSLLLDTAARVLVPFLLVFAVYVLVHGHVSPGGGFQGGVLFGLGLVALRLVWGPPRPGRTMTRFGPGLRHSFLLASAGLLLYVGIGFATMALGGAFLDYGVLPLGDDPAHVRELATLGVEAAVFLAVSGTVAVLFETIVVGISETGRPLADDDEAPVEAEGTG